MQSIRGYFVTALTSAGLMILNSQCTGGGGGGSGNRVPIADAGSDQTVFAGDQVTLDGSGSSDLDPDTLRFEWIQTVGPTVTLDGDDTVSPTFTAPAQGGALTFQLTVDDQSGGSDVDSVIINVSAGNTPPSASAGPDQEVTGGETVALDGSDSADADGDPLTFEWQQTSGPPVSLSSEDTARPTFVAPDDSGALEFQLTVADGIGGIDIDTVTILVDNNAPMADAGDDQIVSGLSLVTLAGTGSFDPDGDPLIFEWTQTDGPSVSITGEETESATFTAPNEDTTLIFELSVDDGNGGVDTDTVTISVGEAARLFVANVASQNVIGFTNPSIQDGDIAPATTLAGDLTLLSAPADIVVNDSGRLLVINSDTKTITAYDDVESADGNRAPDGVVSGPATSLVNPLALALAEGDDILFVADTDSDDILVFEGTGESFDGNLAPARRINSPDLNNPFGMNLSPGGDLYVANNGVPTIVVFADPGNLNGPVGASRTITSVAFDSLFDVAVDANDNMFVVDSFDGAIHIFRNASDLSGPESPDATLSIIDAVRITALAVDSNDVGYIVDTGENAIYSFDAISTLSGPFDPDRIIQGAQTGLNTPMRVFLTE